MKVSQSVSRSREERRGTTDGKCLCKEAGLTCFLADKRTHAAGKSNDDDLQEQERERESERSPRGKEDASRREGKCRSASLPCMRVPA